MPDDANRYPCGAQCLLVSGCPDPQPTCTRRRLPPDLCQHATALATLYARFPDPDSDEPHPQERLAGALAYTRWMLAQRHSAADIARSLASEVDEVADELDRIRALQLNRAVSVMDE
jgi:hypothetical protein